jgi:hypothetical protein
MEEELARLIHISRTPMGHLALASAGLPTHEEGLIRLSKTNPANIHHYAAAVADACYRIRESLGLES